MMTNDTEQAILNQLNNANNGIEYIKQNIVTMQADISQTKEDIKTMKNEISNLKEKQGNLNVNISWIKVLFTIAASIITILLGALITLLFMLLRNLS
jgi:septal ring factor EnvC (AmiA/AmiB activator)